MTFNKNSIPEINRINFLHITCIILFITSFNNLDAQWLKKGEANFSEAAYMETDINNHVIVGGKFVCSLSADTFLRGQDYCDSNNLNVQNIFIAKYDSTGEVLWLQSSKTDTSLSSMELIDFTTDISGNIIFTGWYDSIFVMDNDTLVSSAVSDIFVGKLDINGNLLWLTGNFASSDSSVVRPTSIISGPSGQVYLAGIFRKGIDINGKSSFVDQNTIFFTEINPDGTYDKITYAENLLAGSRSTIIDLFYTPEDSLIALASFVGQISFGGSGSLSSGLPDTNNIILFFMSDTIVDHSKQLPVNWANTLSSDQNLNIILTGNYVEEVVIENDTLHTSGEQESFIIKLDRAGNLLWLKHSESYGTQGEMNFGFHSVGVNNEIYIGGQAGGDNPGFNFIFNEDTVLNIQNKQALLIKIFQDGSVDWVQLYGNEYEDMITTVQAVYDNLVYVSGYFSDSLSMNNISINNRQGIYNFFAGSADLFPSFIPVISIPGGSTEACDGDSILLATTPDMNYTYQWMKDTSLLGSEVSQWVTESGTYKVKVTNQAFGVTKPSADVEITIHSLPDNEFVFNGDTAFCAGDSLLVTSSESSSAVSYQWFHNDIIQLNDTLKDIVISQSGAYHLELINNETGCSSHSDSLYIMVLEYPDTVMTAHDSLIFCVGDSVLLTTPFDNQYNYQWYMDDDSIQGATDTSYYVLTSGEYHVEISNRGVCNTVVDPLPLTALVSPTATLSISENEILCENDSVTLVANTSENYSYVWFKDYDTLITSDHHLLQIKLDGVYYVEVSNAIGCSDFSDTLFLIMHSAPDTITMVDGELTFCQGDSVSLYFTQNSDYNYTWFRNNQLLTDVEENGLTIKTGGTYFGSISTSEGCEGRGRSFEILTRPAPDPSLNFSDTLICDYDSISVEGRISSNTAYRWKYNNLEIDGAMGAQIYASLEGTYKIIVENTLNHCRDSATAYIEVVTIPDQVIENDGEDIICNRDSTRLFVLEDESYSYQWIYGSTLIPNASQAFYNAKREGYYRVTVTKNQICSKESNIYQVEVLTNPIPNINRSGLIISTAEYPEIQWMNNNEVIIGAIDQTWLVSQSGSYSVEVMHQNGCMARSEETSVCLPLPFFTNQDNILTASPGIDYQWFIDDDTIHGAIQQIHYAQISGYYSVEVTDDGGCKMKTQSYRICVPFPGIELVEGYILRASTGEEYQWYLNGEPLTDANTRIHVPESPGIYKVWVRDYDGCEMESSLYGYQVTSLKATDEPDGIKVYPTFTDGVVNVELGNPGWKNTEIRVYNQQGQLMKTERFDQKKFMVELKDLAEGIYWLHILPPSQGMETKVVQVVKY